MTLNFWLFCQHCLSARIVGIYYHIWFYVELEKESRAFLHTGQASTSAGVAPVNGVCFLCISCFPLVLYLFGSRIDYQMFPSINLTRVLCMIISIPTQLKLNTFEFMPITSCLVTLDSVSHHAQILLDLFSTFQYIWFSSQPDICAFIHWQKSSVG